MDPIYKGIPGHVGPGPVSFDTSLRSRLDDPKGYLPAPNLVTAVNAAMLLGQPLLLSGEPGTGKSGLAFAVASELSLGPAVRVTCKSDMRSGDLFYVVDHIRRLHDANAEEKAGPTERYISLQGLGLAIVRAAGAAAMAQPLRGSVTPRRLNDLFPDLGLGAPQQSVVLIDEIDKAPRDVPNDILTEIDAMRFDLPELGLSIAAGTDRKPFVVITSNSEKALPAPFLRRCVFYTIPFPALPGDPQESTPGSPPYTLENIVAQRFDNIRGTWLLQEGLEVFRLLRDQSRFETKPSPAEFMNWLLYMRKHHAADIHLRDHRDLVRKSLVILLKSERDRQTGASLVEAWFGK